jgi:ribose/xylose/arabinose/galactoside ABC-type transport system permease subunit
MEKNIPVKKESVFAKLFRSAEFGVFIPLLAIVVVTAIVNKNFLTLANFTTELKILPFLGIVALGESFALITGNVDISVGQVSGFMGMLFPYFMIVQSMNPWLSLILTLIAGLIVGAFNGFLIVKLGLPDFVATIGSLYIFQGAKILLTKGYPLSPLPYDLGALGDATPLGISWPFWIAVVLFIIVGIVQRKTIWGRRLYATGDNREVAKLAGINVDKMRITAYSICGLLTAIGGILLTIDLNNAVPQNGDGWEFKAIASCAVGGVSLAGGKGTALGVAIGVVIVFILDNALIMLSVPTAYQKCVTGIVLAASVMFDIIKQKRKIRA